MQLIRRDRGRLRGRRTGGKPALVPTGYAQVTPDYNDETSISYEIGLKGTVTRFVYFTADAYIEHQRHALAAVGDGCTATNACETGATNYTVNGGSAAGSGIEGSTNSTFNVFDGPLTLEADGSTAEAKYVSKPANIPGAPLVGAPVAQNPHWLAGATLNYRPAIVDGVRTSPTSSTTLSGVGVRTASRLAKPACTWRTSRPSICASVSTGSGWSWPSSPRTSTPRSTRSPSFSRSTPRRRPACCSPSSA